jgi:N-acetyl-anhydromuramyl-L-alanine amidase AmpD
VRSISLHWTGHDYDRVFASYHFCISRPGDVLVHHTHDLRANMRDVRLDPERPYAAHTHGRNSWSAGVAVAAMEGATPSDFGAYPITAAQIDALCRVAATVAAFYGIDVAAIRTHAEAAVDDGYFGAGADALRWDVARLRPSDAPLECAAAGAAGDELRRRIAELIVRAR